jgi:hypothetical protein
MTLPPRNARTAEAGLTLPELVVVGAILAVLMRMVFVLAGSGIDAQEYARRLNRVTEINQDILDDIRMDLSSSVNLYGNDALSLAYFGRIDMTGWPAPLTTSRLPRIAPEEDVVHDASNPTPKTGNMLFFAKLAYVDSYITPTSGNRYMTDVYQWVLYYLTRENPVTTDPVGINLVHWISEPMANANQILAITDPIDQAELLEHLNLGTPDLSGRANEPIDLVWTRGMDPSLSGAFRQIDAASDFVLSDTPLPPRTDPFGVRTYRPLHRQGLLTLRHHSVATIHAQTAATACRLGIVNAAGDGFPHAFEIQIVGPSAARQVVVHSVLLSTNNRGLRAHSDLLTLIDCRDL